MFQNKGQETNALHLALIVVVSVVGVLLLLYAAVCFRRKKCLGPCELFSKLSEDLATWREERRRRRNREGEAAANEERIVSEFDLGSLPWHLRCTGH
jgi:hypothetical protein